MRRGGDGAILTFNCSSESYDACSCQTLAMDQPRGNKGAFATFHGQGKVAPQMLPDFTPFEKHSSPTDFTVFYDGVAANRPATPRQ